MKIKVIQIKLTEDTYNQFTKKIKDKYKTKTWNEFVNKVIKE